MISIIMSIGFAVDLSAHIVYAFVRAEGDQPKQRVIGALGHIGWPIFQVGGGGGVGRGEIGKIQFIRRSGYFSKKRIVHLKPFFMAILPRPSPRALHVESGLPLSVQQHFDGDLLQVDRPGEGHPN